jgi:hypothetical protein
MAPKIVDFVEDAGAPGLIASIGAVLLAPVLLPVVAGVGKPLVKSVVKGGNAAFEKARGALAEAGETWEDIVAKARAELAEGRQTPKFETTAGSHPEATQNDV